LQHTHLNCWPRRFYGTMTIIYQHYGNLDTVWQDFLVLPKNMNNGTNFNLQPKNELRSKW